MIEAADIWNLAITLVIVIPCIIGLCFIGFLIHRDSQDEPVHISLPRFIPWSVAARARRVRAEVELAKANEDLHEQRHRALQKQMVLNDLEDERYKRALAKPEE